MNLRITAIGAVAACWLLVPAVPAAKAQPTAPHVGYAFPAGGRQGSEFEITIGGQYLNGVNDILVSGQGVRARLIKYTKPLSRKQLNDLNKKLKQLRDNQRKRLSKKGKPFGGFDVAAAENTFNAAAMALGLDLNLKEFLELRRRLSDPKRQPNAQLAETITLHVTIDPAARPGPRELRVRNSRGVSNPLVIHVGTWREHVEKEPNNEAAETDLPDWLPMVINGQVLPGDVDRFRIRLNKGTRLVAAVSARSLVPYLADAVPGWFQATLTLYDARGNELAYTDDFLFHPDPVIYYEVPETGDYVLEIKDAIYRGREDFVYRIALGEVPFITGVFPLGGRVGRKTTVQLFGWNLPQNRLTMDGTGPAPCVLPIRVGRPGKMSNSVPFALDELPETIAVEKPGRATAPEPVDLPQIVNGRIDSPGDWDVFRFQGKAGEQIVAEVTARRLGSPLDSLLKLTDAKGRLIAANDDFEDKAAGLTTHQADSRILCTLPADGTYLLHLGDTQHQGGPAYAYRLRIGHARPDFALRVVPSSISGRAGQTVPITVHALRRDGFAGDIRLRLKDTPQSFVLSGGWIPAGQDSARMTLTLPFLPQKRPVRLAMEGSAVIDGRPVRRLVVPAEDMMQAFIYRHLVPTDNWIATVTGSRRYGSPPRVVGDGPVKLPIGGTARVRIAAPRGPALKDVQLELDDPPLGIAIRNVAPVQGGVSIVLAAEGKELKPGLKGNLIVNAFVNRSWKGKDGKTRTRRVPLGALPAIAFEVVPGPAQTAARP